MLLASCILQQYDSTSQLLFILFSSPLPVSSLHLFPFLLAHAVDAFHPFLSILCTPGLVVLLFHLGGILRLPLSRGVLAFSAISDQLILEASHSLFECNEAKSECEASNVIILFFCSAFLSHVSYGQNLSFDIPLLKAFSKGKK